MNRSLHRWTLKQQSASVEPSSPTNNNNPSSPTHRHDSHRARKLPLTDLFHSSIRELRLTILQAVISRAPRLWRQPFLLILLQPTLTSCFLLLVQTILHPCFQPWLQEEGSATAEQRTLVEEQQTLVEEQRTMVEEQQALVVPTDDIGKTGTA